MKEYSASKSLPPGRTVWVMSFRHPSRRDPKGKIGLKIRRSLGTTDPVEADRLIHQMNELLANNDLHSLLKRQEAERRFEPIIVSAFYDALETSTIDPVQTREAKVPSLKSNAPKVLLAGVTGSGKTSLLRHLMGSDPRTDRFPSTPTSRTTTFDIEVLIAPDDITYRAVVTFRSQWETTANVAECISSACVAALLNSSNEKIAERLLHHPDQTFRLNYVLSSYEVAKLGDEEWDYEGETNIAMDEDSDEATFLPKEKADLQAVLEGFVRRIRQLTETARVKTEDELEIKFDTISPADRDVAEEYFENILEELHEFDELLDDILEQILYRFRDLPLGESSHRPGGWPETWTCDCDAHHREEFIKRVRWFSNNHARAFGRLVTPLVQGIRVRGPFRPRFTSESIEMVLLDGQGFGHVPDSTASVSTHVTKRYAEVDVIVLVDNATQAMLPASLSILRSVLASGYQRKLAIAFTRTDNVTGPNLPDFAAKRAHVMDALLGFLHNLHEALGPALVESFARGIDSRCFMFAWLDKPISEKSKGVVREMEQLLMFCRDSALPEIPTDAIPVYDPAGLLFAAQSADSEFQELWKGRLGDNVVAKVSKKPWQTIRALTRRIALDFDNREYGDLRPAAELLACLAESIGRFLDKPIAWHGPMDPEQRRTAIDRLRQRVFSALHTFVDIRLLAGPLPEWVKAYEFTGKLSTFSRAQAIKNIVEVAAPIPNEAMNRQVAEFLKELRSLVVEAIKDGGGRLT